MTAPATHTIVIPTTAPRLSSPANQARRNSNLWEWQPIAVCNHAVKHQPTAPSAARRPLKLSELSAPRQALVRLCQSIDYGQILDLQVRDREPQFSPAPTLLLDIKLDAARGGRPESELSDFALCHEVCRLMDRIDELQADRIQRIEVRAGIPRRVLIEAKLVEVPR